MSELRVQEFEEEEEVAGGAAEVTVSQGRVSVLGFKPKLVSVESASVLVVLREVDVAGRSYVSPSTAKPSVTVNIKVAEFVDRVGIYDYNKRKVVGVYDVKDGGVSVGLEFGDVGTYRYLAFPGGVYVPNVSEALGEVFRVKVWGILVETVRISDRWARFLGRSVGERLPRLFWRYPGFAVGLADWGKWVEFVPVLDGMSIRYEVGVSAYCDTPDPYPPDDVCCEVRKNTWWEARLYTIGARGSRRLVGSDRINLSFHSLYKLTYSSVVHKGRCVADYDPLFRGGLCGWESGAECSEA